MWVYPRSGTIAIRSSLVLCAVILFAGCSSGGRRAEATDLPAADAFFEALRSQCGRAFGGRVAVDTPAPTGADPFAGRALVMHVRECSDTELRVPFHVGDDRSRTWVISRTRSGLRLKHDHRHDDGNADKVTWYGGDTIDAGSADRQAFPVDEFSKAMFRRENLPASVANTWVLEIDPGGRFVYELSRPGGRLFRVEFDLSAPVEPPPPPWSEAPLR